MAETDPNALLIDRDALDSYLDSNGSFWNQTYFYHNFDISVENDLGVVLDGLDAAANNDPRMKDLTDSLRDAVTNDDAFADQFHNQLKLDAEGMLKMIETSLSDPAAPQLSTPAGLFRTLRDNNASLENNGGENWEQTVQRYIETNHPALAEADLSDDARLEIETSLLINYGARSQLLSDAIMWDQVNDHAILVGNFAADVVGTPVDLVNAGLGQIGVPVSENPFLGSESIKTIWTTTGSTTALLAEGIGGMVGESDPEAMWDTTQTFVTSLPDVAVNNPGVLWQGVENFGASTLSLPALAVDLVEAGSIRAGNGSIKEDLGLDPTISHGDLWKTNIIDTVDSVTGVPEIREGSNDQLVLDGMETVGDIASVLVGPGLVKGGLSVAKNGFETVAGAVLHRSDDVLETAAADVLRETAEDATIIAAQTSDEVFEAAAEVTERTLGDRLNDSFGQVSPAVKIAVPVGVAATATGATVAVALNGDEEAPEAPAAEELALASEAAPSAEETILATEAAPAIEKDKGIQQNVEEDVTPAIAGQTISDAANADPALFQADAPERTSPQTLSDMQLMFRDATSFLTNMGLPEQMAQMVMNFVAQIGISVVGSFMGQQNVPNLEEFVGPVFESLEATATAAGTDPSLDGMEDKVKPSLGGMVPA